MILKEIPSAPYGKQNRADLRPNQENTPMLKDLEIVYERSERTEAISTGGIGLIHKLVERIGLAEALNRNVVLFKRHLPYFESDHILSLCYNVLCGGSCFQDIELLRNDTVFLSWAPIACPILRPSGISCAGLTHPL